MIKRILALGSIFFCTAVAWSILSATLFQRSNDSRTEHLKQSVASTWGMAQDQHALHALYRTTTISEDEETIDGQVHKKVKKHTVDVPINLDASTVDVKLELSHRQKGLLWYSTYKVGFSADYRLTNPSYQSQNVIFVFPLPAKDAVYDDLQFQINGQPLAFTNSKSDAVGNSVLAPHETALVHVSYRSQGLDSWRYTFGNEVSQIHDFHLTMHTDFPDIDFPENTISPTNKTADANGWKLDWQYKNLISGYQIGMAMPEHLQPGPLAGQISFFAPVSLFFFFFLMFLITTLRGIKMHPMNYFFLACAFFAFHLLLAYLVDHLSIHISFLISSIVSIFLVISYLRLVVDIRFAAIEAGLAQFVYLVLFSYAFFFKGFTGLAVTIGSILTLFLVMQFTGRIDWEERFKIQLS